MAVEYGYVTGEFRCLLEREFDNLSFQSVIKEHIVELHWETWPKNDDRLFYLPDDSYDDDYYIVAGTHSPATADALGELWELLLPTAATSLAERRDSPRELRLHLDLTRWSGEDFFRAPPPRLPIVSEAAKSFLEQRAADWVEFRPAVVGTRR